MIEQHNVFDRALTVDVGLSYQHYNRKDLALRGFLALDAIFLGEINLDRVRSDQWTADVITRYTLNDRWQLELALPTCSATPTTRAPARRTPAATSRSRASAMAVWGSQPRHLLQGHGRERGLAGSGVELPGQGADRQGSLRHRDQHLGIGQPGDPKELATGNGLWQLSTGFSWSRPWIPPSCLPASAMVTASNAGL